MRKRKYLYMSILISIPREAMIYQSFFEREHLVLEKAMLLEELSQILTRPTIERKIEILTLLN